MTREASSLRDRMIFLVGARRSGTNWLQRTLASHPDVVSIPSETFLFQGLQPLVERFQHVAISSERTGFVYADRDTLLDALRDFCDRIFSDLASRLASGAQRIIERTPDHVRLLDLIGDVYPDARFVHIIRDGRDVVRSLLAQSWGPDDPAVAAEEWRSAVEAARKAAPSLAHYREIRYEALLADPATAVGELFAWLGLDASPAVVDAALLESGTLYNVDPSAPTIGSGKWRTGLGAEPLGVVLRVAGDALTNLGYLGGEPPKPEPARRPRSRAEGRRVPRRPRSKGTDALGKEALARAAQTQRVSNRFLGLVAERRFERLEDVLAPGAYVRLVGAGLDWTGRGPEAVERLTATLAEDPGIRGRQVRGDVHPAVPTFVLVAAYEKDGVVHDRIFVLTVEGESVSRVTFYRLPLT